MQLMVTRCEWCGAEKTEKNKDKFVQVRVSNEMFNNLVFTAGDYVISMGKRLDWCSTDCMMYWVNSELARARVRNK